jgi:thiamine-phosphate pyrophosphorylase
MTRIYLISPPKIDVEAFAKTLQLALKTKKVPVFQMRLKGYKDAEIIEIGKKLLTICHQNQTLFILNDRFDLALKIGADGVHFGDQDGDIKVAKKTAPVNFIIGASCYDSKHLAVEAIEAGADYVSFGTFYPSKTKNSKGKPTPEILEWCDEILDVQSVAIGGIDANNCKLLVNSKADFIAVISYVWDNEKGVEWAVNHLALAIDSVNNNKIIS